MFKENLSDILTKIDANSTELSVYAGFDRTNISRMRSGKRIPAPSSSTAQKLCCGIYQYSKDHKKYTALCKAVGIPREASQTQAEKKILEYLYRGCDDLSANPRSSVYISTIKKQKKEAFGERLAISMKLADISNKRLSQLVHADPSLISRYKNGIRTPLSNPTLSEQISRILFSRIEAAGKLGELSKVMDAAQKNITGELFSRWLNDNGGNSRSENLTAAETFLDIFDSFRPGDSPALLSPSKALEGVSFSEDYVYIGVDGLRRAVLRFLGSALSEQAKVLYLYSDESQDWMTQDPTFLLRWASLMAALVKNGTRIVIIHNLDRSLSEMNEAIRSWLPLYMSGMIESYFCRRQKNNRFSHTLFLNPESGCIKAFHAVGSGESRIYHYYTEKKLLEICVDEYRFLLNNSSPLIKPVSPHLLPDVSDVTIVQDVLSLSTMSQELAESFNCPDLMKQWEKYSTAFHQKLESHYIHECIPIADMDEVRLGNVPIWQAEGVEKLFYTEEQYRMHIRDMVALTERYDNYSFYPLKESPFTNIELIVSDTLTKITPASRPGFSFVFSHAPMCRAFKEYVASLIVAS